MRPVMMTCVAACVGLLPAAMSTGDRQPGAKAAGARRGRRHVAGAGADPDRAAGADRPVLAPTPVGRGRRTCACTRGIGTMAGFRGCPRPTAWLWRGTAALPAARSARTFKRPAAPAASGYTPEPLPAETAAAPVAAGEAQRFVQGRDIPAEWWALFHSPALERADRAGARRQSRPCPRPRRRCGRPGRMSTPSKARCSRQSPPAFRRPETRPQPARSRRSPPRATPITACTPAKSTVSYTPDVFGGTRRQIEVLAASAESQRFQLEATYLTLTSDVVAAAVQRGLVARPDRSNRGNR